VTAPILDVSEGWLSGPDLLEGEIHIDFRQQVAIRTPAFLLFVCFR